MGARQVCNVVYFFLAEGRDAAGLAQLDAALTGPVPRSAESQDERRRLVLLAGGEIG